MPSLIEGYQYDLFISYRQKDNKYDSWVTEFVENLKKELEATFKENISLYFDINPQDGLLESHEVSESLENKLKCLIFLPIVSRTYCDQESFAWRNEFAKFVEFASNDRFGLKIKLPGGNVVSRVLPIKIYDLNKEDINLCETLLGGSLRGIEFIYRSSGVNRPLRANEDHANENLNKTYYRDQINKVANSIRDLINGISGRKEINADKLVETEIPKRENVVIAKYNSILLSKRKIFLGIFISIILCFIATVIILQKNSDSTEILTKAILVVDPYNNWPTYEGKIRLRNIRINAESEYNEIIEINRRTDTYKRTAISSHQKEISGIQNGRYFHEIWNTDNNSLVKAFKEDSIVRKDLAYFQEHHTCKFGLLMELKNSGLKLSPNTRHVKFQGIKCFTIDFKFDSTLKINNYFARNWTVFLDQKDFSLKGYQCDDFSGIRWYVVLSGKSVINDISVPICNTYFFSSNDSFWMLDLITRPERSN